MVKESKVTENQCAIIAGLATAGLVWCFGLSGCGITAGPVTLGTTGFLEQVNKGKQAQAKTLEQISKQDREEMNRWLQANY